MTDTIIDAAESIVEAEFTKVLAQVPFDWQEQPKMDRHLTHPCSYCGHQRVAHQGDDVPGTHCRCCSQSACSRFKVRWADVVIGWLWRLFRWLGP